MKRIERRAVSQVYSTREDTSFIENDRFSRADEPIDLAFSISTLVSPRFLSRRKHPGVDVGPWHCYVSDNVLACLFPRPARPRGNKASETTSGLAALLCRSTWRVISQESARHSSTLLRLIGDFVLWIWREKTQVFEILLFTSYLSVHRWCNKCKDIHLGI